MARTTFSRLFDIAKIASTKVYQEIPDFFTYFAQLAEVVVRNLRNGLTYEDNFNGDFKTVSLKHGTPQIVSTSKNPVRRCKADRVLSTAYLISAFNWYYDNNGNFTVCVKYETPADPSTAPTDSLDVSLEIFF